jgi:hypothetical protein
MAGIVWLASYPKSGNTWLRVFLSNYWRDAPEPAHVNALDVPGIASSRVLFDRTLGLESERLPPDEIERRRPELYRTLAARSVEPVHLKVHDAYTFLPDGRPLLPPEATAAAVYLVRNPLDVAVAGAPFVAQDLDVVASALADDALVLCRVGERMAELPPQVPQRLLSWSRHVLSWVDRTEFPVHAVRYEDLTSRPVESFAGIVRFLGLAVDEERVRRAVAHSRFEVLQGQEARDGFEERPAEARSPFFRRGMAGAWRDELPSAQVARIVADHGTVMRRFGYLDLRGEPV